MTLEFDAENHQYSKNGNKYISVTTLVDKVSNDFNADEIIDKILKGQEIYLGSKSELLGLNKEQIKQLWELNRIGKSTYGSYIHNLAEQVAIGNSVEDTRPEIKQVKKFFKNEGYKLVEAEKRVHSDFYKVAGTLDLLLEKDGLYYIADWKTNLNTDLTDFTGDKYTKSMTEPLSNIPNLKYWIYALQMSIYRYLIESVPKTAPLGRFDRQRPEFKFGGQFIIHLQESQKNCPYKEMKQITYKLINTLYLEQEVKLLLEWNKNGNI